MSEQTKAEPVEMVFKMADAVELFGAGSETAAMVNAALSTPETWQERRQRLDREAFERATKIPAADYDGWVSWPDHGPNEGYFESVDELIGYCAKQGIVSYHEDRRRAVVLEVDDG